MSFDVIRIEGVTDFLYANFVILQAVLTIVDIDGFLKEIEWEGEEKGGGNPEYGD